MSRLNDKINSDYFEARNSLNKSKGILIAVHVENEDDRPFWKFVFDKFGVSTQIYPASRTTLDRGKQEVLKLKDQVGKFLVLCVDSDYDYLLQSDTEVSRFINENPFVFQTYAYSIESYKCFSKSLHNVVVSSTLQDEPQLFDHEEFLQKYSSIVYDLLIYSFHNEKTLSDRFTMKDFADTIKLKSQVDISSNGEKSLRDLEESVNEKLRQLEKIPEAKFQEYKNRLLNLGLSRENAYLFVNGHVLYDNVVCMFLFPIEKILKSQHYKQIDEQKKDDEEAKNRRNQYKQSTTNIEQVLRNNLNFEKCFLFGKIESDLRKYQAVID